MRGLVKLIAFLALALWSLFAWAAYGLLGFAGGLAASSLDLIPLPPELVLWGVGLLGGAGGIVVWIFWGLGAIAIFGATMLVLALVGRSGPRNAPAFDQTPDHVVPPARHGQDDVSYSPAKRSGGDIVASVLGSRNRR